MKPSQLAKNLRAIATYIEKTHQPSRAKVASALRSVVASVTKTAMKEPGQYMYMEAVWEDAIPSYARGDLEIMDLVNDDKFESAIEDGFKSFNEYATKYVQMKPEMFSADAPNSFEKESYGPVSKNPVRLVGIEMDDPGMISVEISGGNINGTSKFDVDPHQNFSQWWMESEISEF